MISQLYERIRNKFFDLQYERLRSKWLSGNMSSHLNGIVLMYHHVTDQHVDIQESCQCKIEHFRKTLITLKEQGYQFCTVETALKYIKEGSDTKFAVVTFDDVPNNVYVNAYPILKELSIPFTLFITTGYIGKEGYLTNEQIIEMDNDPLCTVGAHTLTHPQLRRVSNSYEELSKSKAILEQMLKHPIKFLAYPYGRQSSISKKVIRQSKEIGYECAFSTVQTPINDISSKSSFFLPRVVM